jgi:hypothetical protein
MLKFLLSLISDLKTVDTNFKGYDDPYMGSIDSGFIESARALSLFVDDEEEEEVDDDDDEYIENYFDDEEEEEYQLEKKEENKNV